MLNSFFTISVTELTAIEYLICTLAALILGALIGLIHSFQNHSSRNFILTLTILPAVIQAVIMLVNGNLGTGVAVMGAFSLVRFRSVPGNSREISSIFLAMATGLAAGTGYLGVAFLLVAVIGSATILMVLIQNHIPAGEARCLKIVIPENLEFEGIFDDLLHAYTKRFRLQKIKTTNMGSLYELQYQVELLPNTNVKKFMDEIRCRNGNLSVICGYDAENHEEL